MQIETILSFDISNKYRFVESLVYKSMEKAVIFEKNGHLLITSKKNVEELQAGKIPHNIEDILKSRRFIIDKNENFYTDYKNKDSITLYYAEFPQRS